MKLKPATRVSAYEIASLIGEGGMGEVYRARDIRLGRDVAIKVLPESLADNRERLARFEQEARAAASLNHPNILVVYDVGEYDGSPFLVTELLEGTTLRERIGSGALPTRKAVDYAIQIARGLAAAHEKGIVHRDLKPENVFVTDDGRVKILDFGVAKLIQQEPAAAEATALPTPPPHTAAGMVVGTIGYMSPEQARGRHSDQRSDIFALGSVLYEMLSGRRAFDGETAADTLTAILKEDPPALSAGSLQVPLPLERIVARCLEKAPAARFHSADDLAFALETLSGHSSAATAVVDRGVMSRRERVVWATAAALLIVAVLAAFSAYRAVGTPPSTLGEMRVQVSTQLPGRTGVTVTTRSGASAADDENPALFALSPDGSRLAFIANAQVWVRSLAAETAQPVAGTDGAAAGLFWSPDSKSLGFFSRAQMKRVDLESGLVRSLASATQSTAGSWNADGTILFSPSPSTPIMRVAADGRGLAPATRLNPPGQISHRFPVFLADGRHFLFFSLGPIDQRGVYIGSLDSPEAHRILDVDTPAIFRPPYWVLFMRDGALLAQRLNLSTLQLEGDQVPVATRVAIGPGSFNVLAASASGSGVIAYRATTEERTLSWVDRTGRQLSAIGEPDAALPTFRSLSPDGRTLATTRTVNGNTDVWLLDVERGVPRRFTFEPIRERTPVWSPDGQHIAFASERSGVFDLFERSIDGGETTLLSSPEPKSVEDWSADGTIAIVIQDPQTNRDIWLLSPDRKARPFLVTPAEETAPRISPDGRWIAFQSDENGRGEVYVQPFPGPGPRRQVSTEGGTIPRWRRDGRELFFVGPQNRLMVISVSAAGSTVTLGTPATLFTMPSTNFSLSPDGQRILISKATAEMGPVTLLLNWGSDGR